jgi:TRAP-type C4-dicarboxylate transport system permease small subunit
MKKSEKSRLKWFLKNFEEVSGAILLFLMALLAFVNVLTRYFIKYSFASTEELEVSSMVFLTMLGASAAFKKNQHLRLMYLDSKVSEKTKFKLNLLSLVLSFVLFSVIAFLSYFHLLDEIELNITTEALDIPEWIYVMAIPLGSILINIRIIQKIIELFGNRND